MSESDLYLKRGVSSAKSEVHAAIQGLDKGLFPGAFCQVLPDLLAGDPEACMMMHADGAGTKSSLAYLYWKETGDLSVFRGIAQDSLVMNLDDLACVGATSGFILSNTIGRNKLKVPGEVIAEVIQGYQEQIERLSAEGIGITLAGGETADVGDLVRTLIVDSTLMVRLPRAQVVDLDRVSVGDAIVSFASFGQARWESGYNSGIGSNGLTAARHDGLAHGYAARYPETFAPEVPEELVYCGKSQLSDPLAGTPLSVGQALLSPTRTYAPLIKKMLDAYGPKIHGLVHCSGGGQTKCLKFGKGLHYIKDQLFDPPAIFKLIQEANGYSFKDMLPVYNLGARLEAFVPAEIAEALVAMAQADGIEALLAGRVEASDGANRLSVKHLGETYHFEA
ncbi:MAG: AIR synthase related protein [bacterium]|nr:AIR synthase related protein [bacterium]